MKIPNNRTYRIRSTVQKPVVNRDPGFGNGAKALESAMVPALRAQLGTVDALRRIEKERAKAADDHWKTHVEIANQIGKTAVQVGRAWDARNDRLEREEERRKREEEALERAREREKNNHLKAAHGDYLRHVNSKLLDTVNSDGSITTGGLKTPFVEEGGQVQSGPVKAFVEADTSFNETDTYKNLSDDERREFDSTIRPDAQRTYQSAATKEQLRQKEEKQRLAEQRLIQEQGNLVASSCKPGDENDWQNNAKKLAELVASAEMGLPDFLAQTEEGKSALASKEKEILKTLYKQRFAIHSDVYAALDDTQSDNANKYLNAMEQDVLGASTYGLDLPEATAMQLAIGAAKQKRDARIESKYREIERDVDNLATSWQLSTDAKERQRIASNAKDAIGRLGTSPDRMTAAQAAFDDKCITAMAQEHAAKWNDEKRKAMQETDPQKRSEALNKVALDEKAAFNTLHPKARTKLRQMQAKAQNAALKAKEDDEDGARKLVSKWTRNGTSPAIMLSNLDTKFNAGEIGLDGLRLGKEEIRKAAAYDQVFKGDSAKKAETERMIMTGVSEAFAGKGGEISALFKMDKNGFLVYDDAENPMLADGIDAAQVVKNGMRTGTATTQIYGPSPFSGYREYSTYIDLTADTIQRAVALGRSFVTSCAMGNPPDGKQGPVTAERIRDYQKAILGTEFARASNAAASVALEMFLESAPVFDMTGESAARGSRNLLAGLRTSGAARREADKRAEAKGEGK